MRKSECMIQYHLARMPMYGAYESAQYAKANELRENMKNLGAPTGLPPQHRQCGTPCALIAALWCCRDEGQGTLGARARVTKRLQADVRLSLRLPTARPVELQSRFPVYRVGAGALSWA